MTGEDGPVKCAIVMRPEDGLRECQPEAQTRPLRVVAEWSVWRFKTHQFCEPTSKGNYSAKPNHLFWVGSFSEKRSFLELL
ncbi:hypothetical protein NDU88_002724 [Pleurodeles waltl]|uniref:Uncharacterized protein n=1 Tax=Pleurodeles waltl TaxID=8319 RepID=A0AAV7M525_PLEWA|nr:hypothetical protein NDU88_002724 [Pleurodeles waltl]